MQSAAVCLVLAPHSRGLIVPEAKLPPPWNPHDAFAEPKYRWGIIAARVLASATVLPLMVPSPPSLSPSASGA